MNCILKRFLSASLGLMVLAGGAQAAVDAKVKCNDLPVFDEATFSKDAYLGKLNKGTVVNVVAVKGDWAKIELNGNVGYTGAEYLTPVTSKGSSSESGSAKRIKGYTTKSTTLYKSASSSAKKLGTLPKGSEIYAVGVSGKFCKIQNEAGTVTGYVRTSSLSKSKPAGGESTLSKNKAKVVKMDWYDSGRSLVNKGSYYSIYDIRSGTTIRVKYTTGTSHMDLETATQEDTAKLYKLCGGWSWDRRSVILIAEGKYIAASVNCMPHGEEDTISGNGMDGVICLHMSGSKTHGSDNVDSDHQAAINAAYNWAHG